MDVRRRYRLLAQRWATWARILLAAAAILALIVGYVNATFCLFDECTTDGGQLLLSAAAVFVAMSISIAPFFGISNILGGIADLAGPAVVPESPARPAPPPRRRVEDPNAAPVERFLAAPRPTTQPATACRRCGHQSEPDQSFCVRCGSPVATEPPAGFARCQGCGRHVAAGAACPFCGTPAS